MAISPVPGGGGQPFDPSIVGPVKKKAKSGDATDGAPNPTPKKAVKKKPPPNATPDTRRKGDGDVSFLA